MANLQKFSKIWIKCHRCTLTPIFQLQKIGIREINYLYRLEFASGSVDKKLPEIVVIDAILKKSASKIQKGEKYDRSRILSR